MDKVRMYLNSLMDGTTPEKSKFNVETLSGKISGWNYIDGVICTAILNLYDITKEKELLEFVDSYMGYYISSNGEIKGFDKENYNIDAINSGKVLFRLYDYTKNEKYKLAIEKIYNQVKSHPRISTGNFWHKKIYPNQVWLDGIYMCLPFYMEYETKYNDLKGYLDILNQIKNVEKYMFNEDTGLPAHAYDESKESFWCDKKTGLSHNYWSRSLGWFIMALIDIIDVMTEQMYEQKREYMRIFRKTIDALLKYTDKETGMLYQVTTLPEREGNYLETSGSAMLAYSIMKAVRLKVLPERYLEYGLKAYNGIINKYFTCENGEYHLGGICLVAGLGPESNRRRDGSFEYYISEPVVKDDGKGTGPFILAYVESLKIRK